MVTRTFVQKGQGYGAEPVRITAKIGGNVVFSGSVVTVDEPRPALPNLDWQMDSNLYTWTNDVSYHGQQDFELTVQNGTLLFCDSLANYTMYTDPVTGNVMPGDDSHYGAFYFEETVTPTGNVIVYDPYTEEAIDGITQMPQPGVYEYPGQWWWTLPAGSTFTAKLNIFAGNVAT